MLLQWLHSVARMSEQDMEACLVLGGVLVHNVASNGEPEVALQGRLLLWSVGCGACQCHVKAQSQHHRILRTFALPVCCAADIDNTLMGPRMP